MSLEEPTFDASTFSKNRERLAREQVAVKFFDAVVREARRLELLSEEHFSVDGTLIEAWASIINEHSKLLICRYSPPRRGLLPSLLPSKRRVPALARVSARFGQSRPFEIEVDRQAHRRRVSRSLSYLAARLQLPRGRRPTAGPRAS